MPVPFFLLDGQSVSCMDLKMTHIKRMMSLSVCLFLLITLEGCHPSATEKQDILDGMAFAQDNLLIKGNMSEEYLNFLNDGQFLRRSQYFKAGADYRSLEIMVQVLDNVQSSSKAESVNISLSESEREEMKKDADEQIIDCRKLCDATWVTLQEDLSKLKMTPKQFGRVVNDDALEQLMAGNPYKSADD